jgi:hypothetical protein
MVTILPDAGGDADLYRHLPLELKKWRADLLSIGLLVLN